MTGEESVGIEPVVWSRHLGSAVLCAVHYATSQGRIRTSPTSSVGIDGRLAGLRSTYVVEGWTGRYKQCNLSYC